MNKTPIGRTSWPVDYDPEFFIYERLEAMRFELWLEWKLAKAYKDMGHIHNMILCKVTTRFMDADNPEEGGSYSSIGGINYGRGALRPAIDDLINSDLLVRKGNKLFPTLSYINGTKASDEIVKTFTMNSDAREKITKDRVHGTARHKERLADLQRRREFLEEVEARAREKT